MNNELVSVICPCYNSEDYIQRMLDSVKNQTYRDIEMICVDDGSMDRTVNIIKRNIKAFESKGMRLLCIQAKHKGQAAAVNTALKIISGDYFTLIDSDDFFLPESIEKRVVALKNNPECAVSASDFYFVNEDDTEKIIGKANGKLGWLPFQKKQFGLLVTGFSMVTPVGYMIRTEAMRLINPDMEINECVEGQNYQILMPLYYHFSRVYIDEPLAVYVIRQSSHDHMERTSIEKEKRALNLLKMLEEVLSDMKLGNNEIQKWKKLSGFNRLLENL